MTQVVYGREYSLRIGKIDNLTPASTITETVDLSLDASAVTGGSLKCNSEQDGYRDYVSLPPADNVIEIKDLHIETTLTLGVAGKSTANAGQLTIKIFNLAKDNQSKIKTDDSLILRAGYEQDEELPLIFAGQIISAKTRRQGADIVTTIVCGDSFTPRKNLRISKDYPRGTTYRSIVDDMLSIAADFGVPTGEFFVPDSSLEGGLASIISTINYNPAKGRASNRIEGVLTSGFSADGMLFEVLAELLTNIDFRYYLLQGSLYVEPIEFRLRKTVVDIDGSVLIGSIREDDEGQKNLSGDALKQKGIILKVPLNGRITTTSLINVSNIENPELAGSYATESIKHVLNLELGEWSTEITCKGVA